MIGCFELLPSKSLVCHLFCFCKYHIWRKNRRKNVRRERREKREVERLAKTEGDEINNDDIIRRKDEQEVLDVL